MSKKFRRIEKQKKREITSRHSSNSEILKNMYFIRIWHLTWSTDNIKSKTFWFNKPLCYEGFWKNLIIFFFNSLDMYRTILWSVPNCCKKIWFGNQWCRKASWINLCEFTQWICTYERTAVGMYDNCRYWWFNTPLPDVWKLSIKQLHNRETFRKIKLYFDLMVLKVDCALEASTDGNKSFQSWLTDLVVYKFFCSWFKWTLSITNVSPMYFKKFIFVIPDQDMKLSFSIANCNVDKTGLHNAVW